MTCQNETKIKHGCCHPESEIKPSRVTRALAINPSSSTSCIPHGPFFPLNNEERKAVEAHKLQVEYWRYMAIELARRNTIR